MKIRLFVHDDNEERLLSSITSVSDDFFDGFEDEGRQVMLVNPILEAWIKKTQLESRAENDEVLEKIIEDVVAGVYNLGFEEAEKGLPVEFDWTKEVEIGTLSFGESLDVVSTGPPGFLVKHEERWPMPDRV